MNNKKYLKTSKISGYSQLLSKRIDQFSIDFWPHSYSSAKGILIKANDGKIYKDYSISGIGACTLGYANPLVDKDVISQIKKGVASSLNSDLEEKLANIFIKKHPWANKVRFAKSGGEALSIAIRLARSQTGKSKVIFSGYHGWCDWYLSANLIDQESLNNHLIKNLNPLGVPEELSNTAKPFEFNSLISFKEAIRWAGKDLAAVIMEPARSEYPDLTFLKEIRKYTTKKNIPLIFDEISSGYRETNGGYHLSFSNITPDVAVFSKAIGNGYPISAIIGKNKIMKQAEKSFISSTNWTECSGLAASIAVNNIYDRMDVVSHISFIGRLWQESIKELSQKLNFNLQVGGIYGLSTFMYPKKADLFRTLFTVLSLKKGYLTSARFYPNFIHKERDVEKYSELLSTAIHLFRKHTVSEIKEICGKVLPSGFNKI